MPCFFAAPKYSKLPIHPRKFDGYNTQSLRPIILVYSSHLIGYTQRARICPRPCIAIFLLGMPTVLFRSQFILQFYDIAQDMCCIRRRNFTVTVRVCICQALSDQGVKSHNIA